METRNNAETPTPPARDSIAEGGPSSPRHTQTAGSPAVRPGVQYGAAAPSLAVSSVNTIASPDGTAPMDEDSEIYEQTHVHAVYNAIAPHFSATRHTPWPLVASFLQAQPAGAVGLDVGCGNGKYMTVQGACDDVLMMGCDRSEALVRLARHARRTGKSTVDGNSRSTEESKGGKKVAAQEHPQVADPCGPQVNEVLVADGLALPYRDGAVDFAICIAVVHHFSTRKRRQDSIREILRCVRRREQQQQQQQAKTETRINATANIGGAKGVEASRSDGLAAPNATSQSFDGSRGQALLYVWALEQGASRRGWDEGGQQDLLVPWVIKAEQQRQLQKLKQRKGESKREEAAAGGEEQAQSSRPDPGVGQKETSDGTAVSGNDQTFQRYYHLYRKGELEEDVVAAGGQVVSSGYEKDNWWAVVSPREQGQQGEPPRVVTREPSI